MEGYLDLGVEDVLEGLGGLVADLGGELHRELRALDGHDDGRGVGGLARGEVLGGGGRLGLRGRQIAEDLPEGRAAVLSLSRRLDRADLPLGTGDGEGRIDGGQQRRIARVFANICFEADIAVTLAS